MISVGDAKEQWKVAQSRLFDAIDTFHDACVALEAAADWTRWTVGDYTSAEAIIPDVTTCLSNVTSHRRHLDSAELVLCRTLNSSTSLVLIHKLPPEILCSALSFAIGSSPCIIDKLNASEDGKEDGTLGVLVVIQLVCSQWRHLVVNTPSLWSHIDVLGSHPSTGGDALVSRITQIRLERAARAPICLHFHQSVREHPDCRVALFLQPHLRSAYSVVFSDGSSERLARTISEVCSSYSLPDVTRPLNAPCNDSPKLNWPKRALYGITDLRIEHVGLRYHIYCLDHLLAMLSSNPLIRILRVYEIPPYFDRGTRSPNLISLPHLELLEIGNAHTDYSLLSKLDPGVVSLDIRLDAPRTEKDLRTVQSFSRRSRIKSLTLKTSGDVKFQYLHSCISSMPYLRALFLDIGSSTLYASILVESIILTGYVPCLHRLPTDGCAWECSASFPNLKVIGLAGLSWDNTGVLRLAPLVAAYSLDLLVLATCDAGPNPPCDPKIWSWVSKHVKSTVLVRKDLFGDPQDPWNLFIETLRLE